MGQYELEHVGEANLPASQCASSRTGEAMPVQSIGNVVVRKPVKKHRDGIEEKSGYCVRKGCQSLTKA